MVIEVAADATVGSRFSQLYLVLEELIATRNYRNICDVEGAVARDAGQTFLAGLQGRFFGLLEYLLVILTVTLHTAMTAGPLSMINHPWQLVVLLDNYQLTAAQWQIKRQINIAADLKASTIQDMRLALVF